MTTRPLLPLLLGFAACVDRPVGGDTDVTSTGAASTSTTSTSTTSSTTGEPPTSTTSGEAENCLEFEYHDNAPMWMLTCSLPELCPGDEPPLFALQGPDLVAPEAVEVDDLGRARCMVAALRDRAPGAIAWRVFLDSSGIYDPTGLEILGDVAVAHLFKAYTTLDSNGSRNVSESLHRLRAPEFFAACAEGDAMQVWLCLMDAVEPGCLPGPLSCPE